MQLFTKNRPAAAATIAQVSYADSAGFGALSASEARGMPVFAPKGINYLPCEGDRLLMLPVDGAETCIGCLCEGIENTPEHRLESGELRLASAGGAYIHLKNNGDVIINGLRITAEGRILTQ